MIGFAVVFGLLAVFVAQAWLSSQAEMRAKNFEAQKKPIATQTLVVAARPLRFGAELGAMSLRELPWPNEAVPAGAFSKIADLTSSRRVVLTAIEANEPILASKITGAGQRAPLSAVLQDGMKAVTIRVNDVEGVAGFVLPGDRVERGAHQDSLSAYATYRRIVIPIIRPAFMSALIILTHMAIKSYDLVLSVTGKNPGGVADLPSTFMYSYTFTRNQMGVGSTSAVIMLATIAAIMVPYLYSEVREKR